MQMDSTDGNFYLKYSYKAAHFHHISDEKAIFTT